MDLFAEFNLSKTKKADIFEEIRALSILVLIPPPLDYKRQEYLYNNIRPFVKDDIIANLFFYKIPLIVDHAKLMTHLFEN